MKKKKWPHLATELDKEQQEFCQLMPRNFSMFDSLPSCTYILFKCKGVKNPIWLTDGLFYFLKCLFTMESMRVLSRKRGHKLCVWLFLRHGLGKFCWGSHFSLFLWSNISCGRQPFAKGYIFDFLLPVTTADYNKVFQVFFLLSVLPTPAILFSLKRVESTI